MYPQYSSRQTVWVLIALVILGIVALNIFNPPPVNNGSKPTSQPEGVLPVPTGTPVPPTTVPTLTSQEQTAVALVKTMEVQQVQATQVESARQVSEAQISATQQVVSATRAAESTQVGIQQEKAIALSKVIDDQQRMQTMDLQARQEQNNRQIALILSVGVALGILAIASMVAIRSYMDAETRKDLAQAARLEQETRRSQANKEHLEAQRKLIEELQKQRVIPQAAPKITQKMPEGKVYSNNGYHNAKVPADQPDQNVPKEKGFSDLPKGK